MVARGSVLGPGVMVGGGRWAVGLQVASTRDRELSSDTFSGSNTAQYPAQPGPLQLPPTPSSDILF